MEAEIALTADRTHRIEQLYSVHVPGAIRLAYVLTGDREAAEDIAHEGFVRAVGRMSSLRRRDAFGAYLRRTVVNLTRKYWRRSSTHARYLSKEGPTSAQVVEEFPDVTGKDAVWRALLKLPHDQRAAIVLRYFADLSERDAAAALGCPRGTLKSRVSRGLEALRIEMR